MLNKNKLKSWYGRNNLRMYPPVVTMSPTISASPIVGISLSVNAPTFLDATTSLTVQWNSNGVPVSGSTSLVYGLLTVLDVGKSLTATFTATNAAGSTVITSNAVTILGS